MLILCRKSHFPWINCKTSTSTSAFRPRHFSGWFTNVNVVAQFCMNASVALEFLTVLTISKPRILNAHGIKSAGKRNRLADRVLWISKLSEFSRWAAHDEIQAHDLDVADACPKCSDQFARSAALLFRARNVVFVIRSTTRASASMRSGARHATVNARQSRPSEIRAREIARRAQLLPF